MSGRLRVLPLGGLGEIGKNMTVVEYDGRIVVVDAGLMFPTPDQLGIDLVLPDFGYLRENRDRIEAFVLTHAHEDHVGALPFVLRELAVDEVPPIYAGRLTAALVRSRLDEHRLKPALAAVRDLPPGEPVVAGPMTVELVRMAHSIPDSFAVLIETPLGPVLVTGDYKFDQTPIDGQPPDMRRLAEIGHKGLLLLCGDSTNADRPGLSPSEASVGPNLERVFAECEGRVVVTSFASNIHRIQQVLDAARATDRRVAIVGRSMRKAFNVARSLGYLETDDGRLVPPHEVEDFPPHKLAVLSTGSQGEPLSALRRMAHGEHPHVRLRAGDTVVFSATPIPGNERAVNETIDRIYRIGADVVTPRDITVHASGHGHAEDLKLMIRLTNPRYVMPVHGDYRRLRLHAKLAESVGIAPERIFITENGRPLEIDAHGARLGEPVAAGVIFVDGMEVGDIEDVALRDRRMLSADGVFIVVATISSQDGRSVAPPEVLFRGVPFLTSEQDAFVSELREEIERSLARAARDQVLEPDLLRSHLHDDVAAFVYERLRRRPLVLPVVVEV